MSAKDHPNNAPGVPMVFPLWLERLQVKYINRALKPIARYLPGTATIEHRGRKSGKPYQTIVTAYRKDGVLAIALAHGKTDWVKNVLAGGRSRRALRPRRCSRHQPPDCARRLRRSGAAADGALAAAPDRGLRRRYRLSLRPRPTSGRFAGLDERAGGVGDEGPFGLDALMQCTQPIVVALDGEVRQKPDHLAQKVDDGTDVEEFHPQPLHLQVDDLEAGVGDAGAHNLRVLIGPVVFSRPEEMLAQVPQRGRSDVLGEVTAASPENPGNLGPPSGAGVAAGHQVKRRIGKGQWRFIAGDDDDRAQRMQPPSGHSRVGWPRFGSDHGGREVARAG